MTLFETVRPNGPDSGRDRELPGETFERGEVFKASAWLYTHAEDLEFMEIGPMFFQPVNDRSGMIEVYGEKNELLDVLDVRRYKSAVEFQNTLSGIEKNQIKAKRPSADPEPPEHVGSSFQ
jgi:hypothetical protein